MNKWQRWKDIMKCYPFEEKRLAKWEPPYIVQPKYDGYRCRAVPIKDGGHILISSEGNMFYSAPHIEQALARADTQGLELDGELYSHSIYMEGGFNLIDSICSRTKNLHERFFEMQFHIFDYVSEDPQGKRIVKLSTMRSKLNNPLHISPFWLAYSLEEVMDIYNEIISWGYEGMIVRHVAAPYERKRSVWLMKFKPKQTDIYKIVGYNEEVSINGLPKGTLGSLVLSSKNGETFSVGSGFTERSRQELWDRREGIVGKECEISYQHITSGRGVPRFPIYGKIV